MRRQLHITLFCICAVIGIAAFWAGYRNPGAGLVTNTMSTDTFSALEAEDEIPHADPAIVGHWLSADKPGWHKVYYDDFDETQRLFWGKEWDESDDVFEYDLLFHGNGWFRWIRQGNTIHEYATMDYRDVPIHHAFIIRLVTTDSIVYHDSHYKKLVYRFTRL